MENCFQNVQHLRFRFSLILLFLFLFNGAAYPWGGRGHALVCESAIHLVKDKTLKQFLINKTNAITYLCNLPDTYWRSVPGAALGGPTHFFEPDLIGLPLSAPDIGKSYLQFSTAAKGKENLVTRKPVLSASRELGSSWWRADQFFRLAVNAGLKAKQKKTLDKDDVDLYQFWVMMGLLGHFIADNAQPLHNTKNYDGWENGHGGLHSYYESDLVNELPPSAIVDIIKAAPRAAKDLNLKPSSTIIENMKKLSILSYQDIDFLMKNDPLLEPSTIAREKGMELKSPAKRKTPTTAFKTFQPMLISNLSRSAVLLSFTWEQIYEAAKQPPIKEDHSVQFPHQYEFIAPDYLETEK